MEGGAHVAAAEERGGRSQVPDGGGAGGVVDLPEHAVVGTQEELSVLLDANDGSLAANAGVHDHDKEGILWEMAPADVEEEARLGDGVGLHLVAQVDNAAAGAALEDGAFDLADVGVEQTEVSEQNNET